jgi:hypothetical protein
MQLRLVRAIVSLDGPEGIFESKRGRERRKKEAGMLYFKLLERQLHVLVVIIIIKVIAPIMHRKEVHEADIVVQCLMLHKVTDEGRYFENLVQ